MLLDQVYLSGAVLSGSRRCFSGLCLLFTSHVVCGPGNILDQSAGLVQPQQPLMVHRDLPLVNDTRVSKFRRISTFTGHGNTRFLQNNHGGSLVWHNDWRHTLMFGTHSYEPAAVTAVEG